MTCVLTTRSSGFRITSRNSN